MRHGWTIFPTLMVFLGLGFAGFTLAGAWRRADGRSPRPAYGADRPFDPLGYSGRPQAQTPSRSSSAIARPSAFHDRASRLEGPEGPGAQLRRGGRSMKR